MPPHYDSLIARSSPTAPTAPPPSTGMHRRARGARGARACPTTIPMHLAILRSRDVPRGPLRHPHHPRLAAAPPSSLSRLPRHPAHGSRPAPAHRQPARAGSSTTRAYSDHRETLAAPRGSPARAPRRGRSAGWGDKYIERVHDKGKLTARERVARLIDPGSPVYEVGTFVNHGDRVPRRAALARRRRGHRVRPGRGPLVHGHRQRQHRRVGRVVAAHAREDRAGPDHGAAAAPADHLPGRLQRPVPARAVALASRAPPGPATSSR